MFPAFELMDIKLMASRWNQFTAMLPYSTRKISVKSLYYLILVWLDAKYPNYTNEEVEAELGRFAGEVCRWIIDYPGAEDLYPHLIKLKLNNPTLVAEVLDDDDW
tara:strand:+ start:1419 stop:1733 length:315 start_codon:yes stop_codon:yes gene_type:complete